MPDLLPRYGTATLADVLPALLHAIGSPLDERPPAFALPPARAAVLLLVDGLGHELLRAHAADAPVLAGLADAGPLTVGFPSTTPISLTSLGTGLPPGAHGTLGLSFRVGGELLDALGWSVARKDRRDDLVPERVQPEPTALERAAAAGVAVRTVSPRAFRTSGLTRSGLRGGEYRGVAALGDLAAEIVDGAAGPGPRLVYGYHADLDALGHVYGPGTPAWRWQLRQIDALLGMLVEALPAGTLLAVTGDHGMVTVDRLVDADERPELRSGVALLGGDPRARHVYTEPGAAGDVLAAWRAVLGEDAWVASRDEAVAEGWFGPVGERVRDRIGDVVVALRGTAAVVRSEAEPYLSSFPGQHGSFTADEQLVPLLVHS
ncbi:MULTISPECIES: nucleotide pyrophosphatase/phosphodiesterase family protein [unclassified Pseudonocardia]|uniref:alkaline phosphatase family protein n=1 Tax=unclassified Pseudonocardia TaxID=2619320 RepID=UPI0001FFE6D8|nr:MULTISPECIES: nucleotide pyrophosphatase/phosphodiesterase family protein [unclassified Pseudonocardia]ALL75305.1 phosphodiesterase [Pseudonocardia sp. EC080610-09]ALL82330.1 phosphodiesterase [Pseudonocardia sp. EC080619-01]OLM20968.1 Alkaline phosphodiesterase I / Nucleotide pyrophosphatase [Pseudonocardia sp. Ae707_Ps1]